MPAPSSSPEAQEAPPGLRLAELLAATAFYAAVAVLALWPVALDPGETALAAATPAHEADRNLIAWLLAWGFRGPTTDPLGVFDANIFHPFPNSLASSEHMLGFAPIAAPIFAWSGNAVLALSLSHLIGIALSGSALFALLRHWRVPAAAALFGGFVYAFTPARLYVPTQLQLTHGQYLPIALLFLDRTLRNARPRDAAGYAVFLAWQVACSVYLGFAAILGAAAHWSLGLWGLRSGWASLRGVVAVALATLVAGVAIVALYAPYSERVDAGAIARTSDAQLALQSNRWVESYLERPSPGRYTAEALGRLHAYVGLASYALAALGCAAALTGFATPSRRRAILVAFGLTTTGYVLALGPSQFVLGVEIPLPYALFRDVLPGFASMRLPGRFAFLWLVGISALAGLGLAQLHDAIAARWGRTLAMRRALPVAVTSLVIAGTGFDLGLALPREYERVEGGANPSEVVRALAKLEAGPLLELPARHFDRGPETVRHSEAMLDSTHHWLPLVNGYGGHPPPGARLLANLGEALPDARALELLRDTTGLRYVLVRGDRVRRALRSRWEGPAPAGLREVGRYGHARLFELEGPHPIDAPLRDALLALRATGPTLLGHPTAELELPRGSAELRFADPPPERAMARGLVGVHVRVENRSAVPWPGLTPDSERAVRVEFQWRDPSGKPLRLRRKIRRGLLPYDLAPGESTSVAIQAPTPPKPGTWTLEIRLAQGDRRFADLLRTPVRIEAPVPGSS